MHRKIFGSYDIRGMLGEDINSDFAYKLGAAFGAYLCPDQSGTFVVGHDARESSPGLAAAIAQGLVERGHHVRSIGLASTPLVYWWGGKTGGDGSLVVTASHLPLEYNGFKLCRKGAAPISAGTGLLDIQALMNASLPVTDLAAGSVTHEKPLEEYAACLSGFLKAPAPLRIAVDAGNGAAGPEIAPVFRQHPQIEVIEIGCVPDIRLAQRPSNPLEHGALDHLAEVVLARDCAFGMAFDGDADRAVVVDNEGKMVPGDFLIPLIARQILADRQGASVLYDLRASRVVAEKIKDYGGKPVRTRVGHSFIKAAMREHAAVFGGELSGHYYYADLYCADSALRTLMEIVNLVSAESMSLSELLVPMRKYATSGEINLSIEDVAAMLESLRQSFSDGSCDHLDGLSIDYPDWWFNARGSQTEPLLRICIGAARPALLDEKRELVLSLVRRS